MNKLRRTTGAGMIASALFAAFFILLPLGIFGFELLRFSIGQLQLRSVCDASALSGACGIASTKKGWTPKLAQEYAMESAFITFKQNELLGKSMDGISTANYNTGPANPTPAPGQCIVNYTLLDQNFNKVTLGDAAAKVLRCEAFYGYQPPIGGALGFTDVPIKAFAEGGLPQLDIVLCFDVSGSIDDQTRVSFVKRRWDPGAGFVRYDVVSIPRSGGAPQRASIFNIQDPPRTGSSVNAVSPQNLTLAGFSKADFTDGNTYPYQFSPTLRAEAPAPPATSEIGQPPGNYPPGAAATGTPTTFTDLVVNLDDKNVFAGGVTDPVTGLQFKNVAVLVEAARGNLNNAATFDSASPGHALPGSPLFGVTANAQYQTAYLALANNQTRPLTQARNAASNFFNTMNISANCHLGLVAFSNGIGTSKTSTWDGTPGGHNLNIDKAYAAGGTGTFPVPRVRIVPTPGVTNYDDVQLAVGALRATGKTAIAASLEEAILQLDTTKGMTRPKARRAIVLFTDGIPNVPSVDPTPAYDQADSATAKGIRVYCVGLSQNTAILSDMRTILKRISTDPARDYYEVTTPDKLDEAFQSIAKSLIVLR